MHRLGCLDTEVYLLTIQEAGSSHSWSQPIQCLMRTFFLVWPWGQRQRETFCLFFFFFKLLPILGKGRSLLLTNTFNLFFWLQQYGDGLPFPTPGDFPNLGIKLRSAALQGDSLLSETPGKPKNIFFSLIYFFWLQGMWDLSSLKRNVP